MGYRSLDGPGSPKASAKILWVDCVNNGIVHSGGHKDPRLAAVSVLDVMRVAEMYPETEDQKKEVAAMAEHGSWPETKILINNVATTVMPVPTNTAPPSEDVDAGNRVVDEQPGSDQK